MREASPELASAWNELTDVRVTRVAPSFVCRVMAILESWV